MDGMDAALFPLALAGLGVTFYTHLRLRDHVRSGWQTHGMRGFLALVGVGIGIVAVDIAGSPAPVLPFLVGFGAVHLAPALVLMLKGLRGEGRS